MEILAEEFYARFEDGGIIFTQRIVKPSFKVWELTETHVCGFGLAGPLLYKTTPQNWFLAG